MAQEARDNFGISAYTEIVIVFGKQTDFILICNYLRQIYAARHRLHGTFCADSRAKPV